MSESGNTDSGNFGGTTCSLQIEDSENWDSFFIGGPELLRTLQEAGEAFSETLFNALVLNGKPMRLENFLIQENLNSTEGCRTSRRAQHRDAGDEVVQCPWQ